MVHGKNGEPGRLIWNIETDEASALNSSAWSAAGAIVIREPYVMEGEPGASIATLADPDGNYFQLMAPMSPQGETAQ